MVCGICGESGHNRRTCQAIAAGNSFSTPRKMSSSSHYHYQDDDNAPRYTTGYSSSYYGSDLSDFLNIFANLKLDSRVPLAAEAKRTTTRFTWNKDALAEYEKEPSASDCSGWIYVYRDLKGDAGHLKIGKTKVDVESRVRDQERKNEGNYKILYTKRTYCYGKAERMVHKQFGHKHAPRAVGDGRTEWFNEDLEVVKKAIGKAAEKIGRNPHYVAVSKSNDDTDKSCQDEESVCPIM